MTAADCFRRVQASKLGTAADRAAVLSAVAEHPEWKAGNPAAAVEFQLGQNEGRRAHILRESGVVERPPAAALRAIEEERNVQLNKGGEPAGGILQSTDGTWNIADFNGNAIARGLTSPTDALTAAVVRGFEIDPRVIKEYGQPEATNATGAAIREGSTRLPREPAREGPARSSEAASGAVSTPPESPARRKFRTAADGFGSETTPVASHILNDIGGILSKSRAKTKGLLEKNSDLWDGAPNLSGNHPTHNKVYQPTGELPDVAAQSLFEAGLLKEPSADAMWQALARESQSARTEVREELAQRKEAAQAEQEASEMPAVPTSADQWADTLPDAVPKLRRGEKQGDLLSRQTEDLSLVGDKGIDYEARQQKADAELFRQREAAKWQDENQEAFGFGPGAASAQEPVATYEQRRFANQVQADLSIAQQIRENVGNRYYEPISNKITAEEATRLVNARPISDVINAVMDEKNDIRPHIRATMGQIVIKRLNDSFHGLEKHDAKAAETVLDQSILVSEWLQEYYTTAGQVAQTAAMFGRLTPEGKLRSMQNAVRKSRDRYTAEHGPEVAEILEKVNAAEMTATERLKALKELFKTNGTARKVKPLLQKLIDASRDGKLGDQQFYEIAGERLGLPTFTKETAATVMRLSRKIEEAPEGMPRDKAVFELAKFIQRQKGFDGKDVPIGIYYANMLSGYNTQLVNGLDTFINVGSEITGLALANPRAAARLYHNMLRGFNEGRTDFLLALTKGRMVTDGKWLEMPKLMEVAEFGRKGGVPINVKSRTDRVIKAVAESSPATILNGWKYVGRLMQATDAFMFRGAYEARVSLLAARLARDEGLRGRALDKRVEEILGRSRPQTRIFEEQARDEGFTGREFQARVQELRNLSRSPDFRADAADFAGRATYNHKPEGWIGYMAEGLGNATNRLPVLKIFVPFTRIVANVTNRGLNYTPLGFKRAFYGYERGKPLEGDARASMLARATIGTAGMATLLAMQQAGLLQINGQGPGAPERRRQLEAAGWRPYTIRVQGPNGKYHYISYLYTPLNLGLSMIGNMSDMSRYGQMDEKAAGTRLAYSLLRIPSTIFSQSFVSGLSNLFSALGKAEVSIPALKNIMASTVGSATTPRIVLDMQRLWDPKKYSSETIQGDLLRNTPFAAMTNKPALSAFGEPITQPTNRFVSDLKDDAVWRLVVLRNLRVSVPSKDTDMPADGNGEKRRITPDEYYEYLEVSGKRLKQLVLDHYQQFQQADDEAAQKALSKLSEDVRRGVLYDLRKRELDRLNP